MSTIRRVLFRTPRGQMSWEDFAPWFRGFLRDEIFKFDHRDTGAGRIVDQRILGQLNTGGKRSTQSVQPLSSNDLGGGFAEIVIAAHTVRYDFRLVSYNSGTISGLPNSTLHFVYADDPEYAGGAVSYSATTQHQTVTAGSGRIYLGKITTDAPAGGGTQGGWGGGGGGGGNPLP